MVKPVHIFIDRQELVGWTDLKLTRRKEDMTGEATFGVFMGWVPENPTLVNATRGREVLIYIGGFLAFTGIIDRRRDSAKQEQPRDSKGRFTSGSTGTGSTTKGGLSGNLSPDSYNITFTCRGKTKYLIDSSQQHPTGTFLRPTNRSVFEELVAPWGTEIRWEAEEVELDKVRLRDGGTVADELAKVSETTSLYVYETRDGALLVTDGQRAVTGESLVLGTNIQAFDCDQAEDQTRSVIKVKGQRTEAGTWGEEAVLPTITDVRDSWADAFLPITVQMYGNGTEQLLTKRAQFEANKRSAKAKRVEVEVYHLQQTTGQPWDLGDIHYVEIPPAGVFDLMEVTELRYEVDATKTLKTVLTLSPAPVKLSDQTVLGGFLADVEEVNDLAAVAANRKAQFGVSGAGLLSWGGPVLSFITNPLAAITGAVTEFLGGVDSQSAKPPLQLPPGYKAQDEE